MYTLFWDGVETFHCTSVDGVYFSVRRMKPACCLRSQVFVSPALFGCFLKAKR